MSKQMVKFLYAFIENCLIDYGLSPKYIGFHYLAHALHWSILDTQAASNLSINLYPRIAETFSVTPSAVEHGIRNLFNSAYSRRRSPALSALIGTVSGSLTNTRCIAVLSHAIRTKYAVLRQTERRIKPPTVS